MKNLVKELLAKQEVERKELEKKQEAQKLELGQKVVNKVNELMEVITSLGLGHLVNGISTVTKEVVKEVKVEVPVEVVKEVEVIKEVEVVKEVVVDVNKDLEKQIAQSTKRIAELEEMVANQKVDKEDEPTTLTKRQVGALKGQITKLTNEKAALENKIAELEAEKETLKKTAGTWQSKYTTLFNSVKTVEPVVEKEVETKVETEVETKQNTETKGMLEKAKEAANKVKDADKEKAPEKQNTEKEVVVEKEVKLDANNISLTECTKYKRKRDEVHMYDGGKCYVLASKTCQQITVIPKVASYVVTEELVGAYQKELVKIGYNPERTNVSPVVINHKEGEYKGYFARTEALEGVEKFSNRDVFAGYIYKGTKCYLFTWDKSRHSVPAMYKLYESVQGRKDANSIRSKDIEEMSNFVGKMFDLYEKEVAPIVEARTAEAMKKAEEAKQRLEADSQVTRETKAKIENARANGNVLGRTKIKNKRGIKKNKGGAQVSNLSPTLQNAAEGF